VLCRGIDVPTRTNAVILARVMPLRSISPRAIVVLGVLAAAGCGPSGSYVWVSELPREYAIRPGGDYLIGDGDTVNVRVFNQEALSTRAKVRSDGRLAMPALGDVEVRGKRPSALKAELEARLKDYVNAPSVTVTVEEFQPIVVAVLGEVAHPGSFPVDPRASVAHVLATAGGLTDYASRDRIFVIRTAPRPMRVRFTYAELAQGSPAAAGFAMHGGDLMVVE
jgi:polysaccharide biosynthesis/export protein